MTDTNSISDNLRQTNGKLESNSNNSKIKELEKENMELKKELAKIKSDYLMRFNVCNETQQYLMKDIELLYDKVDDLSLACGTMEVKLCRFSNILPIRAVRKIRKKLLRV